MSDWPPPADGKPLYTRDDYPELFDARAYLKDFYTKADNEPAMRLVLTCLPSIVGRLTNGECGNGRLLDVGSGPTIHVACAFRNRMGEIYLSDYLEQNRNELEDWRRGEGRFDWSAIVHYLSMMEGSLDNSKDMENEARSKVSGVLPCNIFEEGVIPAHASSGPDFDVVTSFFCLEYAAVNTTEYRTGVSNVAAVVKPGGYLVLGGVMNSTWCGWGGRRFSCYTLTENELVDALDKAGMQSIYYVNHEDMYVVIGQKRS